MAARIKAWHRLAPGALVIVAVWLGEASAQAQAPAAGSAAVSAAAGADLALQALAFVGTPYRFGGDDPARGFDCSGLVRHVVREVLGIELPRTAEAIARAARPVPRDALQVGDLVFFNTRGPRNSHVGVYIGDGQFVHAPARRGLVRVEALRERYWHARFNGGRRLSIDAAAIPAPVPSEPPGPATPAPAEPASTRTDPADGA